MASANPSQDSAARSIVTGLRHALQVARDRLELLDGRPLLPTDLADRRLQAVIDMVVDERPLRFRDGLLDGVQLLRELHTGSPAFDHRDRAAQVPFGAPEPPDDFWMGLMEDILA